MTIIASYIYISAVFIAHEEICRVLSGYLVYYSYDTMLYFTWALRDEDAHRLEYLNLSYFDYTRSWYFMKW